MTRYPIDFRRLDLHSTLWPQDATHCSLAECVLTQLALHVCLRTALPAENSKKRRRRNTLQLRRSHQLQQRVNLKATFSCEQVGCETFLLAFSRLLHLCCFRKRCKSPSKSNTEQILSTPFQTSAVLGPPLQISTFRWTTYQR